MSKEKKPPLCSDCGAGLGEYHMLYDGICATCLHSRYRKAKREGELKALRECLGVPKIIMKAMMDKPGPHFHGQYVAAQIIADKIQTLIQQAEEAGDENESEH